MSLSATSTMVMSIIAISAALSTTAVMPTFEPETCSLALLVLLNNSRGLPVDGCGSVDAGRDLCAHPRPQLEASGVAEWHQNRQLDRGRGSVHLLRTCLAALSAHAWPGNVRELRTVIERARAFPPAPSVLRAEHLRIDSAP